MLRQDSSFNVDSSKNGSALVAGTSSSISQGLDLQSQLQKLEELIVLDGFKLPLSNRTIVDEEQLLSQLLTVEKSIPETIREAESILQMKEDIIARARQYAQEIIKEAEQRAAQIADELTIIQQAEIEAQQLRKQVQDEVEKLRRQNFSEVERVRRQTQQEIESLRKTTQMECEQIQRDSDTYADNMLQDLEHNLEEMLRVIQNGRRHIKTNNGPGSRP